jgi:hypothetical protein
MAKPGTLRSSTIIEERLLSIKRNDIDNRKVDFSDIGSGRRLPPVHPGKILRDEFLTPLRISVYELANAIKVPRTRANDGKSKLMNCAHRATAGPRHRALLDRHDRMA